MIKEEDMNSKQDKKTYTGKDVIEATKEMLKSDSVGSKLTPDALDKLSRLLAKTVLKGDM
jgi:hypothetical protein